MKKKLVFIYVIGVLVLLIVSCNDKQENDDKSLLNLDSEEFSSDGVNIDKNELENTSNSDVKKNEVIKYQVGEVFCIPSSEYVNKDIANESPIVGKIIEFDSDGNIFLDGNKYVLDEQNTLSMKELMDIYNLYYSDAERFGGNVERKRFIGENISFSVIITQDEKYLLQLREVYETDAFYILNKVNKE